MSLKLSRNTFLHQMIYTFKKTIYQLPPPETRFFARPFIAHFGNLSFSRSRLSFEIHIFGIWNMFNSNLVRLRDKKRKTPSHLQMGHGECVHTNRFIGPISSGTSNEWVHFHANFIPIEIGMEQKKVEWSTKLLKLQTLYSKNGVHFMRMKTARETEQRILVNMELKKLHLCLVQKYLPKNDGLPLNHLACNCVVAVDFCFSPFILFSNFLRKSYCETWARHPHAHTHSRSRSLIEYGVRTLIKWSHWHLMIPLQ